MIVFTRAADLPDQLDAHAIEHIGQMTGEGWPPDVAAEAWIDWVEVVAQSAADAAHAECSWRVS